MWRGDRSLDLPVKKKNVHFSRVIIYDLLGSNVNETALLPYPMSSAEAAEAVAESSRFSRRGSVSSNDTSH